MTSRKKSIEHAKKTVERWLQYFNSLDEHRYGKISLNNLTEEELRLLKWFEKPSATYQELNNHIDKKVQEKGYEDYHDAIITYKIWVPK